MSDKSVKLNTLPVLTEVFHRQTSRRLILYSATLVLVLVLAMLLAIQTRLELAVRNAAVQDEESTVVAFDQRAPGTGWHAPEDGGAWTRTESATLELPLQDHWYALRFRVRGVTAQMLDTLEVTANGQRLQLNEDPEDRRWSVFETLLPPEVITGEETVLTFSIDDTIVPAEAGLGDDTRPLGLRFSSFEAIPSLPPVVQPVSMFLLMFGVAFGGAAAALQLRAIRPNLPVSQVLFLALFGVVVVTSGLVRLLVPEVPSLQVSLFAGFSLLLGVIMILLAPTPVVYGKQTTVVDHLALLWEKRYLLAMWTRYNIVSRYSQAFLGILWIVLQPLAISMILAFVFSQIIRAVDTRGVPFISFFLAAMVFWTFFTQGVNLGTNSLISGSGIMQKVYFPREILVLVKLGEAIVDVSFMFVAMLVINAVAGVYPSAAYVYLPFVFLVQAALILGIMLFASYLSMMVRDIPQLVSIVLRFMFYLTPILYPGTAIPDRFGGLGLINPLAPLVGAYREIILYGNRPDIVTLYYPAVLAVVLIFTGYLFFKQYEKRLVDYI